MVQKGREDGPPARDVHPPLWGRAARGAAFPKRLTGGRPTPLLRLLSRPTARVPSRADSHDGTFILNGPGGSILGRLSMDRVKTGVAGLDTMLSGGLLPARPYVG